MLSRDFVQAYLIGQVQAGVEIKDAKINFADWLSKQSDAIASSNEKQLIMSDLDSYTVASQG